jgi:adenylosuccinate lyase
MKRISANEEKIRADLNAHWEIISEGAQTILRAAGRMDAYETLKQQTRGQILTESDYKSWLETLDVDDGTRRKLQSLAPENYAGLAIELCDVVIEHFAERLNHD